MVMGEEPLIHFRPLLFIGLIFSTACVHTKRTVKVFKNDGSQQCGFKKGLSLEEMETQLKDVKIFSKEKSTDGLMHIQVCGANTGSINVYEINEQDLNKAKKAGFQIKK